ncbi:polysaccharide deacetylase family protein [Mucilaginibacter flavus]|uniref:polysaccharide deacetylase family protein n=1 Tax=Mucilaginibacter flavus TaxID=931504 RepID=UPI0025B3C35C|nr:polysaccharide deacetylase family protein [Mucilaginibacter flavus]MDN3579945.1 polysaccharide deacetylase family protein [Mucilaginibacter flavus]
MRKLLLVLLLIYSSLANAQQRKKVVIMLTYDDAIASQLNIAIPQLDSMGFKGTFFLMGNINKVNIPQWRQAALKGHELANHSLYHPCLLTTVKANQANNSGAYTVYMMIREIGEMNNLLFAVDGKTGPRTYAYPCTEVSVGGVNYVDSLRKAGLVKYARIGGGDDAIITAGTKIDPLLVPAWGVPAGVTGDELIAYVKKVQQSGIAGVLMFHGVGGDYITTPAAAHRQLLAYLKQHQDEIEVTTFQQGMDGVAAANHN